MLTRRRFSAFAAAAAGTALVAPLRLQAAATRSGLEFGVQLYTVRKNLSDLPAMLGLIHSIGYTSVETFSAVYNRPARELKALIEGQGLKAPAGHFDYPTLEEKVDYAAELGMETMICPMIPMPLWKSLDGFKQGAEHLNKAAAKARAAGLKFGYHPHNYEFKQLEGGRGFDVLMRELDPSVRLELDIFWAATAGENPLELMRKNRERLALLHIKDRKAGAVVSNIPDAQSAQYITEAGAGTLDWKALLGEAKRLGVKQYFVDQDETALPIEECLRANWKYLSQLSV
ncbi:MAG: sugar phosphate isomerase/epimerase [Terracidiphilus sp.]|nr:sugar phosphate isomerase/epimerase [Terracidiphilus sp.]MDR3775887.1 sugar phosphate isomerase/epimerase [Terracidiphilus sp.]